MSVSCCKQTKTHCDKEGESPKDPYGEKKNPWEKAGPAGVCVHHILIAVMNVDWPCWKKLTEATTPAS